MISSAIAQLLVKDAGSRLSLDKVEQHPWIRSNADEAVLQRNG